MFPDPLGAEARRVEDRDHAGAPARSVVLARTYATSRADLWNALTDRARLPLWFLPIEGGAAVGERYRFEGGVGGVVERCDPLSAIDVTWEFGGGTSWLRLRLASVGTRTRLILAHIVHVEEGAEDWAEYGPGAAGVGWDLALLCLGRHLESGGAVDRIAVETWSVSEQGRAFLRDSAAAWAEAHIAAGEAPEAARAMAERTAAFYTGG